MCLQLLFQLFGLVVSGPTKAGYKPNECLQHFLGVRQNYKSINFGSSHKALQDVQYNAVK